LSNAEAMPLRLEMLKSQDRGRKAPVFLFVGRKAAESGQGAGLEE
jgi:hypothetical protein